MRVCEKIREFAAARIGWIAFNDVKSSRRERTNHLIEYIAQVRVDHRLPESFEGLGKKQDMLVLIRGVLAHQRGEFFRWRKITLEIITDPLRVALATAVEVQHPAMRDRIGHKLPVKPAFDGVNNVRHYRFKVPQAPTSNPKPMTAMNNETTA